MNRTHLLLPCLAFVAVATAQTGSPYWGTYARSFTHRANAPAPTQNLNNVLWSTPVDRHPQYTNGGGLLIHYGSPLITHNNVICVPVKAGVNDVWVVEGRNATTGSLIYTFNTDYTIPTYPNIFFMPSFGPALSPDGKLYVPAAGGTILRRDNPEAATSTYTRFSFYPGYSLDRPTYTSGVKICTPLTVDAAGNIFFGFVTFGTTMDRTAIGAAKIISGVARISPTGVGTWKSVTSLTNNPAATHVQFNCAPALSIDGSTVYVGIKKSGGGGYLVGLNSTTLGLKYIRRLLDPSTGYEANMSDQSSGAPMIGTDGDVYFGIIEVPIDRHNRRGFLLHFDKTLATQKTFGSFGWDNTPSLIPSSLVPSYLGVSPYLIVTKYNNYAGIGTGDGVNKIALLDPFATQTDSVGTLPVMREILTIKGPSPDPEKVGPQFPNAVYEWCVNTTLVDYNTKSALINSEDGHIYRWDLQSGTLTQGILLDGPRGQAYTPTLSGPTGIVYAINNARLFAIGN